MRRITTFFLILLSSLLVLGTVQVNLYEEPPAQRAELSRGNMAYDEYGAGEIIILIHGSPGSKEVMEGLGKELATNYTVYAIDMFGFGDSQPINVKNFGVEAAAHDLAEFLDEKNIFQATILGYSWGGGVAISFAQQYPERTKEIILVGSIGAVQGLATKNYYLEKIRYYTSYPFALYYPGLFILSYNERKGFLQSFMQTDMRTLENALPEITTPARIIHGRKDTVSPPYVGEKLHEELPNSQIIWYEGNHFEINKNPATIAERVNEK